MQLDLTTSLKTCPRCGEIKSIDAFAKNAAKASGRASHCKPCCREASRRRDTKAYRKQYREAHREQFVEYSRRWRVTHPGYYDNDRKRLRTQVHNHPRRTTEGKFTTAEWEALCAKYGHRCVCCGSTSRKLTVDHVVPVKHGGTSWISNIQPLCWPCNRRKGDQTIDYRPEGEAV